MNEFTLPVNSITNDDRIIDKDVVSRLAESIKEIGLIVPIAITPLGELVAGGHRLAAVKKLGWETIPCTMLTGTMEDPVNRIAVIDENLIRREIPAVERTQYLAERKKLYLELHPETEKGKNTD